MEKTKKFRKGGIIGTITIIVTLLLGFSGGQLLNDDFFDSVYVCDVDERVGLFDELSVSGKTAYYFVDGEQKYNVCSGGVWVGLLDYIKIKNINPELFFRQKINSLNDISSSSAWLCSHEGCAPKNGRG